MATRTLAENTAQAIADFKNIKKIIEESGVEVSDGTPTSEYGNKVNKVYQKGNTDMSDIFTDNGMRAQYLFYGCTTLTTAPQLDTTNVQLFDYMFHGCTTLAEVPIYDMTNATSIKSMFYKCENLKSVPLFNTTNVTTFYYAFAYCKNLTEIPVFNTSKVTNFDSTFMHCTNLITAPELDFSKATTVNQLFAGCQSLKTVTALSFPNCTRFSKIFQGCSSLIELPACDFSGSYSSTLFNGCTNLKTIESLDISDNREASGTSMFAKCYALENITFKGTISVGSNTTNMSDCTLLTVDSLMSVINALYDFSSSTSTHTFIIGETNLNKLTDEQKAIATAKGWTLT